MEQAVPSEQELAVMELQNRYYYSLNVLGVNLNAFSLYRIMAVTRGPWTEKALAEHSGMSRTTVRSAMKRNQRLGGVTKVKGGWFLNDLGLTVLTLAHRDAISIASGNQVGFGENTLKLFIDYKRPVQAEAKKVSFAKPIPLKSMR